MLKNVNSVEWLESGFTGLKYSFCALRKNIHTCSYHAANCSLNRQELDQFFGSDVHKRIDSEEPVIMKFLVTGKVGVGKSTVVNALVGMDIAKTEGDVVSATEEVEAIVATKNGIQVHITDIPSLGDLNMKEDDNLDKALKYSKDINLFLFCLKMTERLDRHHIDEIKAITDIFGEDIRTKELFTLTSANKKEQFASKLHECTAKVSCHVTVILVIRVAAS